MSPRVGEVTPRTRAKWSTCSKEKMVSILKSSKAICLRRQLQKLESNVTKTKDDSKSMLSSNPLPGVIFEPDRQCQILFDRPDSYVCNQEAQDNGFCQKLWLMNYFLKSLFLYSYITYFSSFKIFDNIFVDLM